MHRKGGTEEMIAYLERTGDGDKTIRAEILKTCCIHGHEVDDVSGRTTASIIRQDESLLIDRCDEP